MITRTTNAAGGVALSFDSWAEYEAWEREHPNGLNWEDKTPEQRFWETAALSDAMDELCPHPRVYFTASFDSFEEYEEWKRAQTNPRLW